MGMLVAVEVSLKKDGTGGVFEGIGGNGKGGRQVWEMKD